MSDGPRENHTNVPKCQGQESEDCHAKLRTKLDREPCGTSGKAQFAEEPRTVRWLASESRRGS